MRIQNKWLQTTKKIKLCLSYLVTLTMEITQLSTLTVSSSYQLSSVVYWQHRQTTLLSRDMTFVRVQDANSSRLQQLDNAMVFAEGVCPCLFMLVNPFNGYI